MKNILILLAMLAWIPAASADYKETMDPNGLTKNLKTDFGMVDDNAANNQSGVLQKAIDAVSAMDDSSQNFINIESRLGGYTEHTLEI